jgi:hypothetical protein
VAEVDNELLIATVFMVADISAGVTRIRDLLEEAFDGEDPEDDG